MPDPKLADNYKQEYARYRYYFGRIYQFYQKPVTKVSLALLLTIFSTIFFAVFAIRPTLVTIAELLRKIDDQQTTLNKLKNKSAALATAQQEFIAAGDKIDLLNQLIPQVDDIPSIITNVEADAAANQLPLNSISVDEFQYPYLKLDDPGSPKELPVSTELDSPYVAFKTFIHDIVRLPRLLAIKTLNIGSGNNQNSQTQSGAPSLSVSLNSYSLPIDVVTPSPEVEP